MSKKSKVRSVVSLLALSGATLTPLAAHATGVGEVSPDGKGIAGGALLGAELVLVTEAALDVQPAWAYLVGGVAGAAAGGVGGYFIEQEAEPRIPMLMLAGGLVFAIPTVVAVLSATAYEPPADYLQDTAPADEPVAEPPRATDSMPAPAAPRPADEIPVSPPGSPAQTTPAPSDATPVTPAPSSKRRVRSERRLSLKLPPPALVGFDPEHLALGLGVPNIELRHAYTRMEQIMFDAPDVTEVRVPLLNVPF